MGSADLLLVSLDSQNSLTLALSQILSPALLVQMHSRVYFPSKSDFSLSHCARKSQNSPSGLILDSLLCSFTQTFCSCTPHTNTVMSYSKYIHSAYNVFFNTPHILLILRSSLNTWFVFYTLGCRTFHSY